MVVACYKKTLLQCLCLGTFCGILLDLLSPNAHLGIYPLVYGLSLFFTYQQRHHFFSDSVSTLPILTFYFSIVSTCVMALLLYLVEGQNLFSWHWIMNDLIILSMNTAGFAFCCFVLPSFLLKKSIY